MTSSARNDSSNGTADPSVRRHRGPFVLAVVMAVAVAAPLARKGWLLLLDWVPGPHLDVTRATHGLTGSLPAGLPMSAAVAVTERYLGAAVGWLPVALALFLAVFGAARLVGGPPSRWVPASVLYGCNPLIYERLAVGHVHYLLAYALLPIAAKSAIDGVRRGRVAAPALWLAAMIACTVHYAWIGGVLYTAIAVVAFGHRGWQGLRWLVGVGATTALTSAYLWLPLLRGRQPFLVTALDLAAYRTQHDPVLGLYPNVAGLYGFWRVGEIRLPKQDVAGWPFFLLAILLVVLVGVRSAWKTPHAGYLVRSATFAGVAGFLLALGDQGPTGGLYRLAFDHVPAFSVMREPQKFIALVALAYAVGFGHGAERLVQAVSSARVGRLAVAGVAALPLLYSPTLAGGLAGRVAPAHYPPTWLEADRLMGAGEGRVLSLPWHQYLRPTFSDRVIGNPAANVFRRDVIVPDNVELPRLRSSSTDPRSPYLEFLFSKGRELCAFGDLVAPLGVEFVALARAVDFAGYSWLSQQVDLEVVLDRPDIVVYRNLRYQGIGYRVDKKTVVRDWGEVIERSRTGQVSASAIAVRSATPGAVAAGGCTPPAHGAEVARTRSRRSSVAYGVPPGPPVPLILAEPYDSSWSLVGQSPRRLVGGAMGFEAPARGGVIRFEQWTLVRFGYVISGLTVVVGGVVVGRRRRNMS